MTQRLAGKVALITGTARGQGRAAALLFAAEGATVVGCDLDVAESMQTAEMVEQASGIFESTAPVNLTDEHAVRQWVDEAATKYGGIDIL